MYNKKYTNKNSEKKILKKVKKQWAVLSIASFGIIGLYSFNQSQKNIVNADVVNPSNNNSNKSINANSDSFRYLKWGTANVTFDEQSKTLTINGQDNGEPGTLTQDGQPGDINFKKDVKKIIIKSPVFLPVNAGYTFGNFNNLTDIEGLDKVDASNTKVMDGLFAEDHNLEKDIDISKWNTSNVVSMNQMFNADKKINIINLNGINTHSVENMYGMFANCYNLDVVTGINGLDYSNVTDMTYWFAYDVSLDSLNLSNVYAPKVQKVDYMFINDVKLRYLDLSKFSTENINDGKMFWFQLEQPYEYFPYNNQPEKIKSHLIMLVTGADFDGRKVRFESFGGNRKILNLDNGQIYQFDTNNYDNTEDNNSNYPENVVKAATNYWRGAMVKFVDSKTGQQVGNTLLAQGLANISSSPLVMNIPSGYSLTKGNTNIITFTGSEDENSVKTFYISKNLNITVNLTDEGKTIKSTKLVVPEDEMVDVSTELPTGYEFVGSSKFQANDNQLEENIEIRKTSGTSSAAPSSAESSATSEAAKSGTSSATPSSAESSATSEAATSGTSSAAPSSAESSATSEAATSGTSSATPSSAESSATSEAATSGTSSATPSSAESSATSEAATSGTSSSAPSSAESSATSEAATSGTSSSAPSSAESSATSEAATSGTSSAAPSSAESSATSEAATSGTSSASPSSAESSATSEAATSGTSSAAPSSAESSATSEAATSGTSSAAPSSAESSATSEAATSGTSSAAPSSAESSATSEAATSGTSSASPSKSSKVNRIVKKAYKKIKKSNNHGNNGSKPFRYKLAPHRVYMVKGFYRYSSTSFSKKNRLQGYKQHKRPNAVMFTIVGETKSKHGLKRYKVYQIVSKKEGLFRVDHNKWGYITAKPSYMRPLYYSKNVHKVRVIGKGLRVYKDSKLSKYVKSYKRGTVLKVKAVKRLGTTYRLQLSDGRYVSSNKNLVRTIK
ncbi:BspA family leucine-rich repeat surface protein [Apilactobacillus kunkeei]|uniref:BspA family leucine-rich repeat surface protein n=1 Tax=Apilactobacillus kunkeei TaxID=148814 RepID=UPI0039DF37F4